MNRIRELRTERGLTQEQLAEMIGTTDATIQRLETGKRQLTQKWAELISAALKVDVSVIFGSIIPAHDPGLPVVGEVQAGVWREADVGDEPKHPPIPMGRDRRFSEVPQFALLVQGESMNRILPPGMFVVCVPWRDLGKDVENGELVVVERRRDGMVEATVKRIALQGKKVLLMPESTDPRFQQPIELGSGAENEEVAITAKVIGRYEQM